MGRDPGPPMTGLPITMDDTLDPQISELAGDPAIRDNHVSNLSKLSPAHRNPNWA